ncbi:MAG: protein kinase [Bryobacteraceae bacterium]
MHLAAGTHLGPYEILEPLGAGGMGEVYRALDPRLERCVAIKILREEGSRDPQVIERFKREAKAVAALSNPGILAVFDLGAEQDTTYLVTELLEGQTLRRRLLTGALPWRRAIEIGAEIAQALAAAHDKGIIHGDVKPENIFLTRDGRAKILDFGVARLKLPATSSDETLPMNTGFESVFGTLAYMSPEQIGGELADTCSDIFSLGCVLYEMISGLQPFRRDSAASTLAAILNADPPELTSSEPDLPEGFKRVVLLCLQKNRWERFQSARDLSLNLREALNESGYRSTRAKTAREQSLESIAVLPFANAGGDPEAEYFSDGITETIINRLSKIKNLRVVGRVTAFRYKSCDIDPQAIGDELKIRTILTGKVVQRGDKLRVQTELLRTADGSQLWGEHYNGNASEIFQIEEEIAKQITDALELRLSGDENRQLEKRYTRSKEAYQLYLQGKYLWNRRGGASLTKAVAMFEQAVEKDPEYALAWAGIAECYTVYGWYEAASPKHSAPKAKQAIERALEIDSSLAEPLACRGWLKSFYEWDWAGGAREFRRAIELSPNLASAHYWLAFTLAAQRRWEDSIAESRRALDIDPASPRIYTILAPALAEAGQFDEALAACRKALELDPSFPNASFVTALVYDRKGMLHEAMPYLEHAHRLAPEYPFFTGMLGRAYALSGDKDRAAELLKELEEQSRRRYVAPLDIALVHFGLGNKEQGFTSLEKALEDRSYWFPILSGLGPWLTGAAPDQRLDALLRRANLSASSHPSSRAAAP